MITQKLYANFLVKEIKIPLLFPLALCTHLHYQNYTPDRWISAYSAQAHY